MRFETHLTDDFNPLTAEWALRALKDFTLSNARRFYSSMGYPLDGKGLRCHTFLKFVKNENGMESFQLIRSHLSCSPGRKAQKPIIA